MDERVSIGRVKRDLSELINRVAFGGERIVLTSRGKPKAALVGLDDYEKIERAAAGRRKRRWDEWAAKTRRHVEGIAKRRGEEPVRVEEALRASRDELEARDGR
ncbi:MAG TPA: type II toxin-antitoxin system Phd/YefM family antitoxin [Thermoanaerobaculia bacterium]|nr:type II toxin-antitoxin system Phd/YefM family antitoxin [Thermoanaerobaculia bacterium]